ncbi:MAG: hypothetical protein ABSF80_05195 [Chitinispirillaceae bacterium]
MKHVLPSVLLIIFAGGPLTGVLAQKYLTGELSGNYPAAEYSISGNVFVLPKTTLSFAPGSVLRFENFTGILVRGALVCKGTQQQPVVFTSSRDVPGGPGNAANAFDWNGIKVTAEAFGITLEHCIVAYSTYGLTLESNTTPVALKEITFHHNGSASFSREKRMLPVTENAPLSFNWPELPRAKTEGKKPAKQNAGNADKPQAAWKKTVRTAGAGAALAGGALWLTGHLCAEHYNNLMMKPGTPLAVANGYKNSRDGWITAGNIGIGLLAAGAAAFTVTFVF